MNELMDFFRNTVYWRNYCDELDLEEFTSDLNISSTFRDILKISGFDNVLITNENIRAFSIVSYYGGKFFQLRPTLQYIEKVARVNNAHTYAELFGGGGRCLLNIGMLDYKFKNIIYNEFVEEMCCLFKQVSTHSGAQELFNCVNNLKFSKENFEKCTEYLKGRNEDGTLNNAKLSQINKAVIAFVTCSMSFNAARRTFSNQQSNNYTYYNKRCERLLKAPRYLRNVEIHQGDYRKMLDLYGEDPKVVCYLDPPYHPCVREEGAKNQYQSELSSEQHNEMIERLLSCRSFLVAGYDPKEYGSDAYQLLDDYCDEKICIGTYILPSGNRNKDTIKKKNEYLWIKY